MKELTRPPDKLLAALNKLLDQAVRVVPRPRDNFASAVRAMRSGRYDTPSGRYDNHRFRRLEAHELLARDITAAVDAGAPERESEFLKRVSVRLHAE
jgi:site-specific DNA-adenine methylase